jgi:hypothetical protein
MNGKGVSEVVDSGLLPPLHRTDSNMMAKVPKAGFKYAPPDHSAVVVGKEGRGSIADVANLSTIFIVFSKHSAQLWADRNAPGLMEFGAADQESSIRKIHIGTGETDRLADTKPCSVQQQEHRADSARFKLRQLLKRYRLS